MLPLVLFEIVYKVAWILIVTCPLSMKNELIGSLAKGWRSLSGRVSICGGLFVNERVACNFRMGSFLETCRIITLRLSHSSGMQNYLTDLKEVKCKSFQGIIRV